MITDKVGIELTYVVYLFWSDIVGDNAAESSLCFLIYSDILPITQSNAVYKGQPCIAHMAVHSYSTSRNVCQSFFLQGSWARNAKLEAVMKLLEPAAEIVVRQWNALLTWGSNVNSCEGDTTQGDFFEKTWR